MTTILRIVHFLYYSIKMRTTAPVPLLFLSINFCIFPYVSKLSWDFYLGFTCPAETDLILLLAKARGKNEPRVCCLFLMFCCLLKQTQVKTITKFSRLPRFPCYHSMFSI